MHELVQIRTTLTWYRFWLFEMKSLEIYRATIASERSLSFSTSINSVTVQHIVRLWICIELVKTGASGWRQIANR